MKLFRENEKYKSQNLESDSPSWLFIRIKLEFKENLLCLTVTLGDWQRGYRGGPGIDGSCVPVWYPLEGRERGGFKSTG